MSYALLEGLLPDIRKASRHVAFKWPGTVEAGELDSEIFLRLAETPGSVEKLSEWEPNRRVGALIRIGHQIASGVRDDLDLFSGKFNYSVEEVKKYLAGRALDRQLNGFDAQVFDIREAFQELRDKNENYAKAIYQRYVLEVPPDKNALSRGLEKLTLLMNRGWARRSYDFENGSRYRTAVANVDVLAATEDTYEGWNEAG